MIFKVTNLKGVKDSCYLLNGISRYFSMEGEQILIRMKIPPSIKFASQPTIREPVDYIIHIIIMFLDFCEKISKKKMYE